MKRIDIVMAQSKNEGRDSLISGFCPHHFIDGIGEDEADCEEINCTTCWNRDEEVEGENKHYEQLGRAVEKAFINGGYVHGLWYKDVIGSVNTLMKWANGE